MARKRLQGYFLLAHPPSYQINDLNLLKLMFHTYWQCLHQIFSYQFDLGQVKEQAIAPEIEWGKYLETESEIFVASFPGIFSFGPRLFPDSPCMLSVPHSLHGIVPYELY